MNDMIHIYQQFGIGLAIILQFYIILYIILTLKGEDKKVGYFSNYFYNNLTIIQKHKMKLLYNVSWKFTVD